MYYELVKHFGDCIYYSEAELGQDIKELSSRDAIIEKELKAVEQAEKWMYAMGENNHLPDQMTRNYLGLQHLQEQRQRPPGFQLPVPRPRAART